MVYIGGEGPVTEQLHAAGVPFRALRFLRRPIRPVQDLRAMLELAAAMREFQPDVVSLHTAKAGWIGRVVAARQGIPAIYTPHGWSLGDRFAPPAGLAFRWAEKAAARWAGAIICVCQYEKDLALRQRVAGAEHLHVVYNGVHDIPPELRAQPGASPVRIVSVARLDAPKDHGTLFRALAVIPAEGWQLDLVGDGPLENEFEIPGRRAGNRRQGSLPGLPAESCDYPGTGGDLRVVLPFGGSPAQRVGGHASGPACRGHACRRRAGSRGGRSERTSGARRRAWRPGGGSGAPVCGDADLRTRFGSEARRTYERRFGFDRMAQETEAVYRAVRCQRSPQSP